MLPGGKSTRGGHGHFYFALTRIRARIRARGAGKAVNDAKEGPPLQLALVGNGVRPLEGAGAAPGGHGGWTPTGPSGGGHEPPKVSASAGFKLAMERGEATRLLCR